MDDKTIGDITPQIRLAWFRAIGCEEHGYTNEAKLRDALAEQLAMRRKAEHRLYKFHNPHDCDACLCPMTYKEWLDAAKMELGQ